MFLGDWLGVSWGADDGLLEIGRIPLLLPLVVLSLAVLVPIFEEVLFRGFLLEGLRNSQLGESGAILMTSFIWAMMHTGSSALRLETFLLGVLLALARLRTGSTYLTALVHGIVNLVGVVLTVS